MFVHLLPVKRKRTMYTLKDIMKISEIITPVNTKFGAPMGRPNIGVEPMTVIRGRNGRICKCDQVKVYQKRVHLIDGYDQGGTYWGLGKSLYVRFTKDLSFVQYFRAN